MLPRSYDLRELDELDLVLQLDAAAVLSPVSFKVGGESLNEPFGIYEVQSGRTTEVTISFARTRADLKQIQIGGEVRSASGPPAVPALSARASKCKVHNFNGAPDGLVESHHKVSVAALKLCGHGLHWPQEHHVESDALTRVRLERHGRSDQGGAIGRPLYVGVIFFHYDRTNRHSEC